MSKFQNFVKNTVEPELFNQDLFEEWLRERHKFGVGFVGYADNNLPTENYMKQVVGKHADLSIYFEISTVSIYNIKAHTIGRVELSKPGWVLKLERKLYDHYAQESVLGSEVLALLTD